MPCNEICSRIWFLCVRAVLPFSRSHTQLSPLLWGAGFLLREGIGGRDLCRQKKSVGLSHEGLVKPSPDTSAQLSTFLASLSPPLAHFGGVPMCVSPPHHVALNLPSPPMSCQLTLSCRELVCLSLSIRGTLLPILGRLKIVPFPTCSCSQTSPADSPGSSLMPSGCRFRWGQPLTG